MSGFTCAKCGAFGLSEDPGECGFRGADGVSCDGERTFSPEQLRLVRRATFAEERAARLDAEAARLRAALAEIAALQTDEQVDRAVAERDALRLALRTIQASGVGVAVDLASVALAGGPS